MNEYITEIAEIRVTDPQGFEAAVARARPYFLAAEGCLGLRLERVIEAPDTYRLVVDWQTLAHHTVTFRNSDGFQTWRSLAAPFFVEPPKVTHVMHVALDAG